MARDWKNSSIDMDEFGGSRLSLKADTIKPANATVITIKDVEKVTLADPDKDDGKRTALVLTSDEYPDRGFWLNKSGMKTLIERIGDKPGAWIGEKVPLVVVRVNNPSTGAIQQSLQVAAPSEWDEVLEAFTGTTRRRSPAKKTAKRGK